METYDIAIVGCGLTGAYMAYRLSQFYPEKKMIILEANQEPGGRLESEESGYSVALDYGGFRYFPQIQLYIARLVQILGLETVEQDFNCEDNFAYVRGCRYRLDCLECQESYNLNCCQIPPFAQTECVNNCNNFNSECCRQKYHHVCRGVNPFSYVTDLIGAELNLLGITFEEAPFNPELSRISFWQFLLNRTCNEFVKYFTDVFGFNFITGNIHSGIAIKEEIALTNTGLQLAICRGFQRVVFRLIEEFGSGVELLTNTVVQSFSHDPDGSIVLKIKENCQVRKIATSKLILTMPPEFVLDLYPWPCHVLKNFDNVYPWRALKLFLKVKNGWWKCGGRSVTDLPIKQVWYYVPDVLLIYADLTDADYWLPYLQFKNSNRTVYATNLIPVSNVEPSLISELCGQISTVLDRNLEPDDVQYVGWHYWKVGANIWKPSDIESTLKIVRNPLPNVYYSSPAWSTWQGWTNGAIECADAVLAQYFGIRSILD